MTALTEIRQKMRAARDALLAAIRRAGLPDDSLQCLAFDDGGSFPEGYFLAYQNGAYHYGYTERGQTRTIAQAADLHQILYYPLQDITFQAALAYESAHRTAAQDSRRILFTKQLELLAAIRADYAAQRQAQIRAILAEHPFNDPKAA